MLQNLLIKKADTFARNVSANIQIKYVDTY